MTTTLPPLELGPMPTGKQMTQVDEQFVRAPLARIFRLAAEVEGWPALLPHYRYVRFIERRSDGGGIVEMSAIAPVRDDALADVVEVADARASADGSGSTID